MKKLLPLLCCVFMLSSCYVRHPRYTSVKQVMQVQPGISTVQLDSLLGTGPYDIESRTDEGQTVYIYKYRVIDIKRIPMLMKKHKGLETEGRFKDLLVTVNNSGTVESIATREEERLSINEKKKINPNTMLNAITTVITITIPALLVYFSFQ